jgi:hypothetical protein
MPSERTPAQMSAKRHFINVFHAIIIFLIVQNLPFSAVSFYPTMEVLASFTASAPRCSVGKIFRWLRSARQRLGLAQITILKTRPDIFCFWF